MSRAVTCKIFLAFLLCVLRLPAVAQSVTPSVGERVIVRSGVLEKSVVNKGNVDVSRMSVDSLYRYISIMDSLLADGRTYRMEMLDSMLSERRVLRVAEGDSLLAAEKVLEIVPDSTAADTVLATVLRRMTEIPSSAAKFLMSDSEFLDRYIAGADTLLPKLVPVDSARLAMSKRQLRRLERRDTVAHPRFSKAFRDSIPFSRLIALSAIAPGLSQVYNGQAWKMPIIYGGAGLGLGLGLWLNKPYKDYKRQYDDIVKYNGGSRTDELNRIQGDMIRYNTFRQLAFGLAAVSYIYSLVDGCVNYPSDVAAVKKATTLSMVCPGAGQLYNKTYWKLPIVIGGGASLIYCVDFNNRGYQRFKRAYSLLTDGDDQTQDEFNGRYDAEYLKNLKNSYRRNRDLCIILTAGFYVLQVIDAHVTAHMKTYDISDDLSMNLEPYMGNFYMQQAGQVNTVGMSLNFRF